MTRRLVPPPTVRWTRSLFALALLLVVSAANVVPGLAASTQQLILLRATSDGWLVAAADPATPAASVALLRTTTGTDFQPDVAVSPDGTRLAIATRSQLDPVANLAIIDMTTGAVRDAGHVPAGRPMVFSNDATRLLTVGADGRSVQLVNSATGAAGSTLLPGAVAVFPLALRAEGWLVAATDGRTSWLATPGGPTPLGSGRVVAVTTAGPGGPAAVTIADTGIYRSVAVDNDGSSRLLARSDTYLAAVSTPRGWLVGGHPGALTTQPAVERLTRAGPAWDVPFASLPDAGWLVSQRASGSGGRDIVDRRDVVTRLDGSLVATLPAGVSVVATRPALAPPDRVAVIGGAVRTLAACYGPSGRALQPNVTDLQSAFQRASVNNPPGGYPVLRAVEAVPSGTASQAARLSTALLGAIGWIESGWSQARSTVRGQLGAPLVSFDCGFGVMQVTSGMSLGALDPAIQERIATDYLYNVFWGTNILIDKWNYAESGSFKYVGDRNPCVVENWYYAVMAYNGLKLDPPASNDPSDYPPNRPVYDGSQPRGNYPYQELVWGLLRNPPSVSGSRLWNPIAVTYPADSLFTPAALQNLPRLLPEHVSDGCGGPSASPAPTPSATPTPTFTPTPTPTPPPCSRTNGPATAPTPLPHRRYLAFVPHRCSAFAGW